MALNLIANGAPAPPDRLALWESCIRGDDTPLLHILEMLHTKQLAHDL